MEGVEGVIAWDILLSQVYDRFQVKVRAFVTDHRREVTAWLKQTWQDGKHYLIIGTLPSPLRRN